jgi:hypothetical protein
VQNFDVIVLCIDVFGTNLLFVLKVFKKAKCTPPKSSNMFALEFQIIYLNLYFNE